MIKRPLIVSTMALTAALMWGAPSFQASAQEKSIDALAPQGGWSVARMDQGAAMDRYCALSRPYAKGLVLTLGRNVAEEYSVAIDFQAAKLDTNKAYSVTLQPGPRQIRAYEMLPASPRAMVIRLGFDESFLDAMKDSGYLKAEIDGKTYQFEVPSFASGKSDLDNCLTGLKGSKPTPKTRVADGFKADKVADAKPMAAKPEAPKVEIAKVEPKPEMIPQPAPVVDAPQPLQQQKPKVEIAKVEPPKVQVAPSPAPEIKAPKIETPKVETPKIEMARVNSDQKPPTVFAANKDGPRVSTPIELQPSTPVMKSPEKAPEKKIEMARVDSKQQAPRPPEDVPKTAQAAPINVPTPKAPEPTIETPKPVAAVSKKVDSSMGTTIVRSNNDALLPKSMVSRPPVERAPVKQAMAQTDLQKKQRDALKQLQADNERLNKALQNEISKPAAMAPNRSQEVVSLQRQIDQLQDELIKAKIEPNKIDDQLKSDVEQLKAENEQLKIAMQNQAKMQAQLQAQKAEAKVAMEMQEKAKEELAKQELAKQELAKQELAKSQAQEEAMAREAEARVAMEMQEKARQELAKKELAEKVSKEVVQITPPPPAPMEQEETIETSALSNASTDPRVMRQLNNLKAENARLSSALQGQEEKLSTFNAKSPAASSDLSAIRDELKLLREENKKLAADARKARSQIDTAVFDKGTEKLAKVREYERKLQAAQNDNMQLSKEIDEMRRMQEDGRMAGASGNWDLETSTKRYNEAEREIKRLGMLLEQQRMAHRQEKAELEEMLFDPAVTDKEQRRRLRELELQLMAAERKLQSSGGVMPTLAPRSPVTARAPRSPLDERVAISGLAPDPAAAQRESLEMQRLNNKIERQNRQLQAYNQQVIGLGDNPVPRMDIKVHNKPMAAPVTANRLPPLTPVTQAPVTRTPLAAPQPTVMADSSGFGQGQIQQLLRSAGVSVSRGVTKQSATLLPMPNVHVAVILHPCHQP